MKNKPIYVSKPLLPPLDQYVEMLKGIWKSGILTHNGPLVQKLEKEIDTYLGIDTTSVVTNGTIAMQLAMRALDLLEGEVITTPFSWVANCNSIQWERCQPVFVDVDPESFNINPDEIEAAITKKTRAILGVHVFSCPCDVERIEAIASAHNLRVIYDGAHAFGVKYNNKSVFSWGDISTTSFHATKLFNTGEGGAVFTSGSLKERIKSLRFFGIDSKNNITDIGCNAKMTEIHAALGLCNIPYMTSVIQVRKAIYSNYFKALSNKLSFQKFDSSSYNYSYIPVLFSSETELNAVISYLNANNVFARRYFYPSLNEVKAIQQYTPCPISEDISRRVLCLPTYNELSLDSVRWISELILETLK
jgi:dTDP-4-amino-4,6-dideoxygalactose transaminase